ncbi:MAG TPA: hypothetical protein VK438_10605 [Xanthobacteraceae bacterium]|nr:hypothetical protein [Xanthobacteraceae bacterium]
MLRDWAKFAGFATFATFALVGSLLWALNYPPQDAEWTCSAESATEHPDQDRIRIFSCRKPKPKNLDANAAGKEDAAQKYAGEDIKITDKLIALFTLALVIVGGLQAYYLWGTVEATRNLAGATKVAAEHIPRVERAYLFLWHELKHNSTPNADGALPGEILEIQFAFRNQGKTPAILRRIDVDIRVVDKIPTELRDTGALDMPTGLVLSSDEKTPFFPRRQLILPEQWADIHKRKKILLFLGVVKYKDVFGSPHETGFCFDWDGSGFSPAPTDKLNYYT